MQQHFEQIAFTFPELPGKEEVLRNICNKIDKNCIKLNNAKRANNFILYNTLKEVATELSRLAKYLKEELHEEIYEYTKDL